MQQHVSGKQMGKAMIEHLEFESYDGRTLRLRIAEHGASVARYLQMQLDNITMMVRNVAGSNVQVQLIGEPSADEPHKNDDAQLNSARDLPAVRKAMDIFDASIIAVQDASDDQSDELAGER